MLGGELAGLRVLAPSVVAVGEPFTITVRSEDHNLNRARGALPAYEVRLDDRVVANVAAGGEALAVVPDLRLAQPGTYRFTVRDAAGRFTATSNPVWALASPEWRVFWGEMHGHTDFAEGQGSPDAFFRYAREDSRLDFATLTEHDFWTDDAEWAAMKELTRRSTEDGRLIAFLGYEWTATPDRGGHHNVFFRTPDRDRVPIQVANRLPMLYDGLRRGNKPDDLLVIPHAHSAGDWTQSDPDLERLAEIYSSHGTFEWYGNMFLRNGFDIGFVGGSDDHRAMPGGPHGKNQSSMLGIPGLAAAMAPAKTADALFDALRSRRTYATSGQRILLDARLNGTAPGQRQADAPRRQIQAKVSGTAPIERIDVIRNGQVVFSRDYATAPLGVEVDAPGRLRVAVRRLHARPDRQPAALPHLAGHARGDRRQGARRRAHRPRQPPARPARGRSGQPQQDALLDPHPRAARHDPALARRRVGVDPLRFELEPTREYGYGQGGVRQPAEIPGGTVELSLGKLERRQGRARPSRSSEYTDRITLHVIDAAAPLDQEFEFTDLDGIAPGDYYYVRVNQLDGGRAWSSPWWVGEKRSERYPVGRAAARSDAMKTIRYDDIAALAEQVTGEFGPWSEPVSVTQDMINRFADLSGDDEWIHVDVERARRESPFGGPIAHGFLTISLFPKVRPGRRLRDRRPRQPHQLRRRSVALPRPRCRQDRASRRGRGSPRRGRARAAPWSRTTSRCGWSKSGALAMVCRPLVIYMHPVVEARDGGR